jgi:hypothetical protein
MNSYERPFADRLQAEVERIPLPPRDRWAPRPRSRSRVLPLLGTLALLGLLALIAASMIEELGVRPAGVATASSAPQAGSGGAQSTCGPQDQTAPSECLIPGTLVEIVGHDGGLMASTSLIRVRLDGPSLSAQLGNPALFESDAQTKLEPPVLRLMDQGAGSAPPGLLAQTVAATGVKVGAPVLIAFDARAPKTSSGAYLLTRFVVVSSGQLPDCFLYLDIARFPRGVTEENGGVTPEAAFKAANPGIARFSAFPMGKDPKAPVWIVAGSETFVATILPDGTWFVSPAKFVGCRDPREVRWGPSPKATPTPTFPMNSPGAAPDPILPMHVAAGMLAGAAIFAQTDPTCVLETDGKTFRCTLKSPPAPETSNFLDAKHIVVIAGRVAGGCVGLDQGGMTWNCFIGQEAVDRRIIGKNLLGELAPFPARG